MEERVDDLLQVLKALSDGTRLKIIDLLMNHDFCVGALSRTLGVSEASVSQHLRVLRNAGLVTGEKRGYYTHYDVNRHLIAEVATSLDSIAASTAPRKECRQHLTGDHGYCANKMPAHRKAGQAVVSDEVAIPSEQA